MDVSRSRDRPDALSRADQLERVRGMGRGPRQVEEYLELISRKVDGNRRTHVVCRGWKSQARRGAKTLRSSAYDILSRSSRVILETRTRVTVRPGVGLQE